MKPPYTCCSKYTKHTGVLFFILFLSFICHAQFRKPGFLYSENLRGGTAVFGNTLMYWSNPDGSVNTTAMNGNSATGYSTYDNGGFGTTNMQYIDVDGNTGQGADTRNSSSADLVLPAGTNNIILARLYWGGRALASEFNMADPSNQKIKIRKGTNGPYQEFPAAQIDQSVSEVGTITEYSRYQAFADITALVQQDGAGTYTIGNGAFSKGLGGDYGNYGGWCIVVVYGNAALNFNSVRVIDGFQEVYNGNRVTTNSILVTGLNVPTDPLLADEAKIAVALWEGDARFKGDFFKLNNILISNAVNQTDNSWNGTITSNGVHVTTKNPNYTDQMGIDIDEFYAGTGYNIQPHDSALLVQFGTTQDQYFFGVVTAVIKMKEPDLRITKEVTDANNNQVAGIGEVLTYKIKGKNFGASDVSFVSLADSLPSTLIFVPGSLKINYCPGLTAGTQTDETDTDVAEYVTASKTIHYRLGNNANGTTGGTLAATDSFEVEFKATFNPVSNGVAPPVVNVARVSAKSASLENFVDDATVTVSGATAQRFTYTFTGDGNWDDPANWSSNKIPPDVLPVFSTIIIDHVNGGQCILNKSQQIASGATIIVNAGKNLVLPNSLDLQ